MDQPLPVVIDPAPLNRFEAFPFGVIRFDFEAFSRTDGIEAVEVSADAGNEAVRF